MVTAVTGGLALFVLGVAAVLALSQARRLARLMTGLSAFLALTFVAFAIVGDRRERRCLDRVPDLQRFGVTGFALPEQVIARGRQREACRVGQAMGLAEPF